MDFSEESIGYNAAIREGSKVEKLQQALALLARLHAAGMEPSAISYSAAISACECDDQWQQALSLLAVMQDAP